MENMQGLFLIAPCQVEARELPMPQVEPDQILVQVKACSICGGDLKIFRKANRTLPHFLFGHEVSGTVVVVGADVNHFQVGDRVAYAHNNYCGTCPNCRGGSPAWCTGFPLPFQGGGGYAGFVRFQVPARGCGVYRIPENLSYAAAALAEPLDCALGAVLRANPRPAEIAAVIGLGGMGHLIAQILNAMDVEVIGIDTVAAQCERAAPYCTLTLTAGPETEEAIREAVLEATAGQGADIVFEAVGVQATLIQAFHLARMGGRVMLVGVFDQPMDTFDPTQWIFRRDLTLISTKGPQPLVTTAGESLALHYLSRGIVDSRAVIRTFPWSEAQAAFEAQASGASIRSVILGGQGSSDSA